MKVIPDPTGPGPESDWSSYPRPAVAEPSQSHLKIVHRDVIIANTRTGIRTLETSHPPTYYFPAGDIAPWGGRGGRGGSKTYHNINTICCGKMTIQ